MTCKIITHAVEWCQLPQGSTDFPVQRQGWVAPQRHDLCYLQKNARLLSHCQDEQSRVFTDWIAQRYPLIFTRQPGHLAERTWQVAIPYLDLTNGAKHRWSYVVHQDDIVARHPLPLLSDIFPHPPGIAGCQIRVFGSYAWQHLTGKPYVHEHSDLDVLISCQQPSITDLSALLTLLKSHLNINRIDAELRLPPFGDCSLTELLKSDSETVLFKNTCSVSLINRSALHECYSTLSG